MKLSIKLSEEAAKDRWVLLALLCASLNAQNDSTFIYENDNTIVEFRPENGINRYVSSSKKFLIDLQALSFSIGKSATMCQSRKPGKVAQFAIKEGGYRSYTTKGLWEVDMNPTGGKNKEYRKRNGWCEKRI